MVVHKLFSIKVNEANIIVDSVSLQLCFILRLLCES